MDIDFHTHGKLAKYLAFSPDYTDWLFNEAIEAGLDALCLTEHFNTQGFRDVYADLATRFPCVGDAYDVNGLLVFPGMETDEGRFLPFDELEAEVHRRGLRFGAAHPFRAPGHLPELSDEQLARLDFLDLNGKDLARDRERSERLTRGLGERLGIPVVSGSDTHQAFQYGCVVTRVARRCTTYDELFAQVEAGEYEIVLAEDAAFRVKCAGYLKRSLKEIDRLGGDYVATILAGQAL